MSDVYATSFGVLNYSGMLFNKGNTNKIIYKVINKRCSFKIYSGIIIYHIIIKSTINYTYYCFLDISGGKTGYCP